ncbi:ABC transporter ATP-binding protein [Sediminispirochaeta bajacaliforniensis]|jgi:putative ABC transport system ATP-binding protein|uniref:ABC transporter ATP-binding protein n=1 Tax=Sediminispirochaeta bajacaliforniensis TaxID=148 RepID=UPI000360778A|nr:ABC transporter ATP-binding protein [Sediminispirochaeta bajacaliforniensis]
MITLDAITKSYQRGSSEVAALSGISIKIKKGDFVAVAGPSGSGKTTMMNIIGLLDRPSSGRLVIEGVPMDDLSRRERTRFRREHLGFIFQSFNLISVLSVFENVELPLIIARSPLSSSQRRKKVSEVIKKVGLDGREDHKPAELSGGQQQRVAIARALVTVPDLVIADEPTANLDSATGERILSLMKEINRNNGTTFLFSTHDPVIRDMADHVILLHDGNVEREILGNGR